MLDTINQMLQATQDTGVNAQLRHSCAPGAGVLELDEPALQMLKHYYTVVESRHTRPAWLDPEVQDYTRRERPTLDERRAME